MPGGCPRIGAHRFAKLLATPACAAHRHPYAEGRSASRMVSPVPPGVAPGRSGGREQRGELFECCVVQSGEHLRCSWPRVLGDDEIPAGEIDLDGRAVVAAVLTGDAAASAPCIRWYANKVEQRPHVLARRVKEHLQTATGRRS